MRQGTRLLTMAAALLAAGAGAAGCLDRPLAPVDPSTQSGVFVEISQTGTTKVDMLFMVDNSNSMGEEQSILAEQIQRMAEELISPSTDAPAVEDLHIGIVTSDMGTGGFTIMTCANPAQGDNGELQNSGRYAGCQETYSATDCSRAECPWLVHSSVQPNDGSAADPDGVPIWEDFGCVATLGTGGCGFEQQLESTLVALTTQLEPSRHNEGFLRPDSLVAIVYVTDEDDCSTGNPEMFNPSREDLGPLNVRCALRNDMLHPVTRYHDAFIGLRPGNEDLVVVAAITGVPIDGSWSPGDSIDALRALQQVNPTNPTELLPSCNTPQGLAFPPVRIAELVYMFGENGILYSICTADWTPALTAITRKIQSKLTGACMTRELLSTDPDVCRVIETLPAGAVGCPHQVSGEGATRTGWQIDLGFDEQGRQQCEVLAADLDGNGLPDPIDGSCGETEPFSGCLTGWFYSTNDAECEHGQVRFTSDDVTSDLSDVRFECRTALCPQRQQCLEASRTGQACDPSAQGGCPDGQICVRHNAAAICGADVGTCGRCAQEVGVRCSYIEEHNPYWRDEALVEAGGCCHEGFHCEGSVCQPNRTTRCE